MSKDWVVNEERFPNLAHWNRQHPLAAHREAAGAARKVVITKEPEEPEGAEPLPCWVRVGDEFHHTTRVCKDHPLGKHTPPETLTQRVSDFAARFRATRHPCVEAAKPPPVS